MISDGFPLEVFFCPKLWWSGGLESDEHMFSIFSVIAYTILAALVLAPKKCHRRKFRDDKGDVWPGAGPAFLFFDWVFPLFANSTGSIFSNFNISILTSW